MISPSDILAAKILVVDDLAANVLLLEQMLRGAGYVCVASTMDPRVVSTLHRKNHYDLILLDLQMPGMDGFQVMDGLKEFEADSYLPVIVITAQPDHKLRALQAGAKDFVSKPFDLAEVLMRVRNMLEVRLLHRESLRYGKALEQKVREVEASRETIIRQSDELKRLYEKLVHEQKVSERLLLNLLPSPIAERLKARSDLIAGSPPEIIADNFLEVSVLFADIVQFTCFSAGMSPERLVAILNEIFADFDNIADSRGLEKIKHRFIYDLWGDAVNVASRMESQGVAGRVQVTEATRQRLRETFVLEERGTIAAKGLGELHTWFLVGRSGQPLQGDADQVDARRGPLPA
jgi:adenylate cyclase